tara:strand:+ start:275 stop:619 length:345 start_codon:yes stop_codon:yes gene_type:complete
MSEKFWQLLRRYINRTKEEIRSSEPIIELPYAALLKTVILRDKGLSSLIKEVREKCGELGHEIDSVVFFAAFDGPIIFNQNKIKSKSDDYMGVYKRPDGTHFAVIFSGSWIEAS